MSSIGKVYARLIYKGQKTLADVPKAYREATKEAFYELYGYELEE